MKRANRDAAVNLEIEDGVARVGFHTTAAWPQAFARVQAGNQLLLTRRIAISPDEPFITEVELPEGTEPHEVRVALVVGSNELIAYSPARFEPEPIPPAVQAPPPPEEIATVEELFLTGQRIRQFHNPALEPDPYWEEALRRDSGNAQVNLAMGIDRYKKGLYEEAERHLRIALERLTAGYTAPRDGEPWFYLGLTLRAQQRFDEAYEAFYMATWSEACKAPSHLQLAQLDSLFGNTAQALAHLERSLVGNAMNTRALTMKAALLTSLGRADEALGVASAARFVDPLDPRAMREVWMAGGTEEVAAEYLFTLQQFPENGLELAMEYFDEGRFQSAADVLDEVIRVSADDSQVAPLAYYFLGYLQQILGQGSESRDSLARASMLPPDRVFPWQKDLVPVLRYAMLVNPGDARAPYYLGNLLFDDQPTTAIAHWELARELDPDFPIVHRNLALAYARSYRFDEAIASMERAVAGSPQYAIHFYELDEMYEAAGRSPEERLALLEANHDVVSGRDDALSREIALKIFTVSADEAIELMQGRQFNVWEGGARFKVQDLWTDAQLQRGHALLRAGRNDEALAAYRQALEFPENLQSSRARTGGRNDEVNYWIGVAQDARGDAQRAQEYWRAAAEGSSRGAQSFFRAMALRRLGDDARAEGICEELIETGVRALMRGGEVDVFAKFGGQASERRRVADAWYLRGLGLLGLNNRDAAREAFGRALQAAPDHLGAKTALEWIGD